MPGISAPRTGHRAGRSGSLRSSLLALVLIPCLGLAAAWGYAVYLLRDAGERTALLAGSAVVGVVLLGSLARGLRVARTLPARITALHTDALALAQHEIPQVVGRLRAGESVPTPPARPSSRRAGDELQQAADGLATVRQAAVAAIVHQAQGREGTKKVFLNIARRTQILIHRQISMLDALEREHEEPELLRELFAVDHLATRMRRNAENLVILGGALPARRWRNAVPMVNVLRSAVSETENYSRVVVQGVPRTSLSGQAVADVIHLVAELIENGTTFSPPYTQVQVSAQEVPKGLVVEVEDRGLGMVEEEYQRLNDYLANPPELDVSALGDDLRLGLFVVARLAARHDVQVTLRPSPYGGTRAVVLVPSALLHQAEAPSAVTGLPAGARVTRSPAPDLRPAAGALPGADVGADAGGEAGADTGAGADVSAGGGIGFGFGDGLGVGGGVGADGGVGAGVGAGGGVGVGVGGNGQDLSGALAGVLDGLLGHGPVAGHGPGAGADAEAEFEADAATGGVPDGAPVGDGGVVIGELLAHYPGGGAPPAPGDPTVNGGLPVGSSIPGLPGAVVVPRPSRPQPYQDPTGGPGADVFGSEAFGSDVYGTDAYGSGSETREGGDGPPAVSAAPTHQRPEEVRAEYGPEGELRTPRVLPRRVRNASLAEQLREAHAPLTAPYGPPPPHGGPPGPSARPADDPSPQRSRATMAAIQHGTRTARAATPHPDVPPPAKEQQ
ncbi:ATP-binding protein [Kitasatospora sp. NPDC001527]|uniref:sensor histidine kinase n=1 Tax=Kitasatospora sp. NPDC001527 TaxID=3154519 RepID=UPI003323FF45